MARIRVAAAALGGALLLTGLLVLAAFGSDSNRTRAAGSQPALTSLSRQPLAFEPNAGRFAGAADFLVRDRAATLAVDGTRSRLGVGASALTTKLVGARPAKPQPLRRLPGVVNWYVGPRSSYRTGLPTFAGVRYAGIYPGVDLIYHGRRGALEYDFNVAPHADPTQIAMGISGAHSLRIAPNGDLVARIGSSEVRQLRPVAYQGKRLVNARFVLDGNRVRFALSRYDHSRPLVIDPVLSYSDYFGGTGAEAIYDVAVDSGNNAVVAGYTSSASIPGVTGGSPSGAVGMVAKVAPDGTRQWATFLADKVSGIAVDGSDNVLIAGTASAGLATTAGSQQPNIGGGVIDAFAGRLGADGSRSWITYLGGTQSDSAAAVAADRSGAAYVVGYTYSTTNIATGGTLQPNLNGSGPDGFLVKYSPSGSRVFGTYMGGSSNDGANAVAVAPTCDSSCPAFVGGYSWGGFPTSAGTDRPTYGVGLASDGFIIRASATGTRDWATYTPHNPPPKSAGVYGVAVSPAGNPTVVGGAGQANNTSQAFISSFVAGNGTHGPDPGDYTYATTSDGYFHDVAYDAQGNAYVVGETSSSTFTTMAPVQQFFGGIRDAFAMKLGGSRNASFPIWATYLGGADQDYAYGVAANSDGGVYQVGYTYSNNFPTMGNTQASSTGPDGFISRIDIGSPKIDSGPDATLRSHDATFTYSGGEPGATYECRLSPAERAFSTCANAGKTYSGLTDGAYKFEVRALDQGGTPSHATSNDFTADSQPHAAFTIAPNPVLAGRSTTFDAASAVGGDTPIVKYEWDLDGDGKFERNTGATAKTGEAYPKAATIPVSLRITTASGATSSATNSLVVSTAGTPVQFGVSINDGDQYTRTPNVTVTAKYPATVTSLLFSNDGGFDKAQTFPAAKTTKWKLDSSGPERLPKIVYVRFLNGPIVSETHIDDIILDETPPKVEEASVTSGAGASSARTASAAARRSWTLKVKAKDSNSGVSRIQATSNKRKPGKALKYKKRLTVKSAKRPRWVRAQDRAGNWSKWKKAR